MTDTMDVIKEIVVELVSDTEVTPDSTFEQLDMDSLAQAEFGMMLQNRLGVSITDDELQAAGSMKEILVLVEGRR